MAGVAVLLQAVACAPFEEHVVTGQPYSSNDHQAVQVKTSVSDNTVTVSTGRGRCQVDKITERKLTTTGDGDQFLLLATSVVFGAMGGYAIGGPCKQKVSGQNGAPDTERACTPDEKNGRRVGGSILLILSAAAATTFGYNITRADDSVEPAPCVIKLRIGPGVELTATTSTAGTASFDLSRQKLPNDYYNVPSTATVTIGDQVVGEVSLTDTPAYPRWQTEMSDRLHRNEERAERAEERASERDSNCSSMEDCARVLVRCVRQCADQVQGCISRLPDTGHKAQDVEASCNPTYKACQDTCEVALNAKGFCLTHNILTGEATGSVGPCP